MNGKPHFRASDPLLRPLAVGERDGLVAMLAAEHLPRRRHRRAPDCLFWRFDTMRTCRSASAAWTSRPSALLRSVVTLPPVRRRGIGRAIVADSRPKPTVAGCDAIYLLAAAPGLFAPLGYVACGAKVCRRRSGAARRSPIPRRPGAANLSVIGAKQLAPRSWR